MAVRPGLRQASEAGRVCTCVREANHTLADVLLLDGTNVNPTLVEDGWCWWYRKYAPGDTVLEGLEKEAREAKKGLWVDPAPVPPWEWRKQK